MRRHPILFAALLPVLLSACQARSVTVDDAYVRLPAVPGRPAAAYFRVSGGGLPDRLVGITATGAARAELHASGMHAGMATMTPLEDVDIPADGVVAFSPAGNHVMLFGLSQNVTPGTPVPLTLRFRSGTTLTTEARTIAAGDDAPY
ncbi:copper chaperone PCu(A)C [Sphingomonas prati]|uniref:Copper chaperone PCu(A)C n=1 Tax=Sphingomonas prati TaxID=1843237 RepID=A0A7W9F2M4_9SPHN|nr:copper chaperone PCu(A)C [Sphingomonas prati]MBB5730682.1 hypothetical protein [Sphingomonas prati]GGE96017.1 hypothetical protein GCM10011404_31440 [Sphingomonas prati]